MRHVTLGFFATVLLLLPAAAADGALIYRFEQTTYTVNPGEQIAVRVFLEQTSGLTILSNEGLFSAGVGVQFTGPVSLSSPADIQPNPAFDDASVLIKSLSAGAVGLAEAVQDPLSPVFPSTGGSSILVGTFLFQAGTTGGVAQLTATDLSAFDETVTGFGNILDPTVGNASATITVVGGTPAETVPEPGTLLLLGLGLAGLVGASRWKRAR